VKSRPLNGVLKQGFKLLCEIIKTEDHERLAVVSALRFSQAWHMKALDFGPMIGLRPLLRTEYSLKDANSGTPSTTWPRTFGTK
jgi:hypothetical protein